MPKGADWQNGGGVGDGLGKEKLKLVRPPCVVHSRTGELIHKHEDHSSTTSHVTQTQERKEKNPDRRSLEPHHALGLRPKIWKTALSLTL